MTGMTMRAAVTWKTGEPFAIEQVQLEEPRADEVLVRVVAAGICQSDMGAVHGHFPYPLPGVLGHEGVGVVEAAGTAVRTVAVGDRVLLSFSQCNECRWCRNGHPAYCEHKVELNLVGGRRPDGSTPISRNGREINAHFFGQSSFAEYAVVHERSAVVLPADLAEDDLAVLAPLACGVQAGAGAVLNVLRPHPTEVLVVAGAGGVGLSAIMATRLCRPRRVIAVDRVAARLDLAGELGADAVIDTSHEDLAERLRELTDGHGADAAIDTTGHIPTLETLIEGLAVRGRCGVVGVPPAGARASFDVMPLVMGRSVQGIAAGDVEPRTVIPVLVEAVRSGALPLDRIVTRYPFDRIGEAADDAAAGRVVKPVLVFGTEEESR